MTLCGRRLASFKFWKVHQQSSDAATRHGRRVQWAFSERIEFTSCISAQSQRAHESLSCIGVQGMSWHFADCTALTGGIQYFYTPTERTKSTLIEASCCV